MRKPRNDEYEIQEGGLLGDFQSVRLLSLERCPSHTSPYLILDHINFLL